MSEYSDYFSLTDNIGILSKLKGQAPDLVLAQRLGIKLLIDERILGSWFLQDSNTPNIILSKDGSASIAVSSTSMKNGQYQWVTHNIMLITLTDGEWLMIRFDLVQDDIAIISITPQGSEDSYIVIGQKQSVKYELAAMER